MVNTTFPIMDKIIRVRFMPELYIDQDCVKLIRHVGAYKHSCALKSQPISNIGPITTFLSNS